MVGSNGELELPLSVFFKFVEKRREGKVGSVLRDA